MAVQSCPRILAFVRPMSKLDIGHFLELQDFGFQLASLVLTLSDRPMGAK